MQNSSGWRAILMETFPGVKLDGGEERSPYFSIALAGLCIALACIVRYIAAARKLSVRGSILYEASTKHSPVSCASQSTIWNNSILPWGIRVSPGHEVYSEGRLQEGLRKEFN